MLLEIYRLSKPFVRSKITYLRTTKNQVWIYILSISFCLCLSTNMLMAQTEITDNTPSSNHEKLTMLSEKVDSLKHKDMPSALNIAKLGLALATEDEDSKWLAHFNAELGSVHELSTNYDSSLIFLDRAIDLYHELNDTKEVGRTMEKIVQLYINQGKLDKAIATSMEALDLYETINDKKGIAFVHTLLSDIYFYKQEYKKGVDYGEKAVEYSLQLDDKKTLIIAYTSVSYNYLGVSQPQKAYDVIDKAIKLQKLLSDDELALSALLNARGSALKHLEKYEEAIRDFEEGYTIVKKINNKAKMSVFISNIGNVYMRMNNYKAALPYKLEGLQIIKEDKYHANILEGYLDVTETYKALEDYKNALHYSEIYNTIRDSFFTLEKEGIVLELDTKYQTKQKEELIEDQKEAILLSKKNQYLSFGIITLLAVILVGVFFFFRKNQKKNKLLNAQNAIINEKNKQKELLLKEIHHRVKNNLQTISSLLTLQAESISDASALDAVLESKNRVASMGLIHQKLYQKDNLAAIEMRDYFETIGNAIIDSFGEKAKNVSLKIDMSEIELDVDTAIPVGLITNELITNSLKHAFPSNQKGQILITLRQEENGLLKLNIADNGEGAKQESAIKKEKGFGTMLIQLLTTQLDGKLEKSIEAGTSTIISFPRQEKSAA